VAALLAVPAIREEEARRRAEQEREWEEQRRQWREYRRAKLVQDARDELLKKTLETLRFCGDLRSLAATAEELPKNNPDLSEAARATIANLVWWTRAYADLLDPLRAGGGNFAEFLEAWEKTATAGDWAMWD
jgi:hypothetical protein